MIDFTNCEINKFKYYGGKNGGKICIRYNDEDYMLKFPGINEGISEHGYSNNCISEYVACNIIKTLGLKVQDTLLGLYNLNGSEKIVVACKDFTSNGTVLKQFAELKNSQVETSKNGYGTELDEIEKTIDEQQIYDVKDLKDFFWDMFIADCLVGNFDRHNGNWGFLYDSRPDEISLAPVYDCGSCLFPQADEEIMKRTLEDPAELELRIFERPLSGIKENGQKIQYFKFISSLKNPDCNKALKRIVPRINMNQIYGLIETTPFLSELQRNFYRTMLRARKERILDFSLQKLRKRERLREQSR